MFGGTEQFGGDGRECGKRRVGRKAALHRFTGRRPKIAWFFQPRGGQGETDSRLLQKPRIFWRDIPVHQVFNGDVGRRFGGGHVGRLGEINRQDQRAFERLDGVELPIFASGASQRDSQMELAGELVRSQRELFVRRVDHNQLVLRDDVVERREGVVAFRSGRERASLVGFPGFGVPSGVEQALAGERHGAHRRVGESAATAAARDGQPQMMRGDRT